MNQFPLGRGKPVVLLVEDEHLIRLTIAGDLEEAGFEVVEAYDAEEAISIFIPKPLTTMRLSPPFTR